MRSRSPRQRDPPESKLRSASGHHRGAAARARRLRGDPRLRSAGRSRRHPGALREVPCRYRHRLRAQARAAVRLVEERHGARLLRDLQVARRRRLRPAHRVVFHRLAPRRRCVPAVRRLPARLRRRALLAGVLARLRRRRSSAAWRRPERLLGMASARPCVDAHARVFREAAASVDLRRRDSVSPVVRLRVVVHRALLHQQRRADGARLDEPDHQPAVSERTDSDRPWGDRSLCGPRLRAGEAPADLRGARNEKRVERIGRSSVSGTSRAITAVGARMTGPARRLMPFNLPLVSGRELDYIREAIANRHLSGNGRFTAKCHQWLQEQMRTEKALLTHSCTAALEMAALLSRAGSGDEVIMPSFTFVSTANAFVLRGATPVFVDIREDTCNLDESLIEAAITPRTRAIVVVHYAGVACDMDRVLDVARRHGLVVIEDAAQGLRSTYRGRPLGSLGDLAALSFHETKNIISGEGGALIVNDPKWALRSELIWEKGTNRTQFHRGEVDKYTWVDIGSSYLPSEISAAVLLAQLELVDVI